MTTLTHEQINALGRTIKQHLLDDDKAILVNIEALEADYDTMEPSLRVTIRGTVGKETQEFTGHAIDLVNAVCLARGKLRNARKKLEEGKKAA